MYYNLPILSTASFIVLTKSVFSSHDSFIRASSVDVTPDEHSASRKRLKDVRSLHMHSRWLSNEAKDYRNTIRDRHVRVSMKKNATYPGLVDYGKGHPHDLRQREIALQSPKMAPFDNYLQNGGESQDGVEFSPFQHRDLQFGVSDSFSFEKIRIQYIYHESFTNLENSSPENKARFDYIHNHVLPNMRSFWARALRVYPVKNPIPYDTAFCYGVPNGAKKATNADLVVYITANEFCEGGYTLASAIGCDWDQYNRPIAGDVDFCIEKIDVKNSAVVPSSARGITDVAIHEFAHVLGFSSADFPFFVDPRTGKPRTAKAIQAEVTCINGKKQREIIPSENTLKLNYTENGVPFFEIVTPTVARVAQNHYNCDGMGGRLENQPTAPNDCFGSHWDERLSPTEMMSGESSGIPEFLSPLTIALFEDSGWYKGDYSQSKISPFGHGAGCDFVYKPCIVDGKIPEYSKGFFCNNFVNGQNSCDPTHRHIASCNLVDYSTRSFATYKSPPVEFQYFDNKFLGSFQTTSDYCPTNVVSAIDCMDSTVSRDLIQGESFGASSRCIETDNSSPFCFTTTCNEVDHVVEIVIGKTVITCEKHGDLHLIPGSKFKVYCPRIEIICPDMICPANCSGRGICNYTMEDPKCVCNNRNDLTKTCSNSEVEELFFEKEGSQQSGCYIQQPIAILLYATIYMLPFLLYLL